MKWPDWFGFRAQKELEDFKDEVESKFVFYATELKTNRSHIRVVEETNLRLISQLREMDQGTFQIHQVAPDWKRIQPIFAKMYEATEKRMATENNRIKNLMVGEIVTAYNEPPQLTKYNQGRRYLTTHEGIPIFEDDKLIEGKK